MLHYYLAEGNPSEVAVARHIALASSANQRILDLETSFGIEFNIYLIV
jgi:hypothetical protein